MSCPTADLPNPRSECRSSRSALRFESAILPVSAVRLMETTMPRSVEDCVIELFQSLGIVQAHLASGQLVPGDWLGLTARHPARIASLTLVSPRPRPELHPLGSRLLVVAGDKGPAAEGS